MNRNLHSFYIRSLSTGLPDFTPAVLSLRLCGDPRIPAVETECVLCRSEIPAGMLPDRMHIVRIAAQADNDTEPERWPRRITPDRNDPELEYVAVLPLSYDSLRRRLLGIPPEACEVSLREDASIAFIKDFLTEAGA